jgi:hypothetical protein
LLRRLWRHCEAPKATTQSRSAKHPRREIASSRFARLAMTASVIV